MAACIVGSGDRTLVAFFATRAELSGAVAELVGSGVSVDAIRVLPKSVHHLDDIGIRPTSKAPEGAALGALVGGLAGALAGALGTGVVVVIPELGAVFAGPWVATLTIAGLGCALGVVAGALLGARLPEYEATYLHDALRTGGALVAVRCSAERAAGVEEILVTHGARL